MHFVDDIPWPPIVSKRFPSSCRIFGDTFLRSFYTAYNVDERTVGLAPATNRRQGDECDADAKLGVKHPFGKPDDSQETSSDDSQETEDTVSAVVSASTHGSMTSEETSEETSGEISGEISEETSGGSSTDEGDDDDLRVAPGSSPVTAGSEEVSSNEDNSEEELPSTLAIIVSAVVGTVILFAGVAGLVLLGRQMWIGRQYRHAPLGTEGHEGGGGGGGLGAFEMADKAIKRVRHGDEIPGPEEDFLQAGEVGGVTSGGKRFVRSGDDEVEVDLGGRGGSGGGAKADVFGRLLNKPSGEGFAEFDNKRQSDV